jgi:hypothetical protein
MAYVLVGGNLLQPEVDPVFKGREATLNPWADADGASSVDPRVRGLDAISMPFRVARVTMPANRRQNGNYTNYSAPYERPRKS